MTTNTEELDYQTLTKRAKRLEAGECARTVRFAVLADSSVQHLIPLLRALFHQRGVNAIVYEAGFDSIDQEILNRSSGLYQFAPDFVLILNAASALRSRFFAVAGDRTAFAQQTIERIVGRWDALRERCPATILQSNIVLPLEAVFGNYDHKVASSLGSVVHAINEAITLQCRERSYVLINDVDAVSSYVGRRTWFDEKLWTVGKVFCSLEHLPRVAQNVVGLVMASLGVVVKCVVLDLDNTLWGGVIGDDGLDGIRLGHVSDGEAFVAFQQYLRALRQRGILLAVASKNTHDIAIRAFREHPEMVLKESDIACFRINWDNKGENIRQIREELNIGFDAMVFLDDNPFERNLVRQMLPDVIVPELPEEPAEYVSAISVLNLFEVAAYSVVDENRSSMYRDESLRNEVRRSFNDVDDYLRSLEMRVSIARFDRGSLPRIAQLIQRSNQFNLATRRHTEAQCETFMDATDEYLPLQVSLVDKFGDYGLISVVITRREEHRLHIDEFLMSCRVLQRGVEQATMNYLFAHARDLGMEEIVGVYRPTPKNALVKDFYAQFGFVLVSEDPAVQVWTCRVATYVPRDVQLTCA